MTFAATGSNLFANATALTTSNQGIGNLLLVEVSNYTNSTVWATGLTGGGATWTQLGTKFSGTANAYSAAVFAGTVTATGAGTATPSWSGTAPAGYEINGHEFTSSVGSWALDGSQGNLDSTNTDTWPPLTPSTNGELYFGACLTSNSGAASGSTSGYIYVVNANSDSMAYNVSCPSGTATSPVWADVFEHFGIMVLMKEVAGAVPPQMPPVQLPPIYQQRIR